MTLGVSITLEELERDPSPLYARLRDHEPVSWVPAVLLWLVTRWDDVRHVDLTPEVFTAATEPSTLNRTMGTNMLGSEGPDQQWIRAVCEPPFRPREVEERTKGMIPRLADALIDGFADRGEVDLFTEFADPMSVRSLQFMLGLGYLRAELEATPVGILPVHRDGPAAIRRWEEIYAGPDGHVAKVAATLPDYDMTITPPPEVEAPPWAVVSAKPIRGHA